MRLSILNGVFSFGYVVGTQLGSVMYTNVKDFYSIFGLSCLLGVFGILYSMFIVKVSKTDISFIIN
jgi:predicted MFS family arabinose efflux permease